MGVQWAMMEEKVGDEPAIISALQNGWQPFAVANGKVWFRMMFFNEATEARSSARDQSGA